jgi:D-mannonate dehydratase
VLSVRAVDFRVDEDSEGNDALIVDVVLPDPVGETWPLDDVLKLHRMIDDAAIDVGVPIRWIVIPRQETQEDYDPADTGDEARR